jgi:DNA-binding MarR family transcriptional regulator
MAYSSKLKFSLLIFSFHSILRVWYFRPWAKRILFRIFLPMAECMGLPRDPWTVASPPRYQGSGRRGVSPTRIAHINGFIRMQLIMAENDKLIYLISKAQRLVWNYLNNELKKEDLNITPPQTTILFSIMKYGPQSMNALSRLLRIKNATTTGLVDRLEKNGLVSRNTVGDDRRRWDVDITEKGVAEIAKAKTIVNAVNDKIKEGCSKREIEAVKKVLSLFDDKFGDA